MIRVLLVDDHKIIRDGLRSMLAKVPDIEVVGEAEDGRSAVAMCRTLSPDVVVMDIGMKDLNGIDATRQIVAECPGVRVIALSMHSDRQYVSEMLRAGRVRLPGQGQRLRGARHRDPRGRRRGAPISPRTSRASWWTTT